MHTQHSQPAAEATIQDVLLAINQFASDVEQRFGRIEQRLDHIEERIVLIEGRLDRIEQRLDSIEGRVDNLERRADHTEQAMVTKYYLKSYIDDKFADLKADLQPRIRGIDTKLNDTIVLLHQKKVFTKKEVLALGASV